jgi:hypothetical protein
VTKEFLGLSMNILVGLLCILVSQIFVPFSCVSWGK